MAPGRRKPKAALLGKRCCARRSSTSAWAASSTVAQMFVFSSSAEAKSSLFSVPGCSPVRGGDQLSGPEARGEASLRRAPSAPPPRRRKMPWTPRSAPRSQRKVCQRSRGGVRGGTEAPRARHRPQPVPFLVSYSREGRLPTKLDVDCSSFAVAEEFDRDRVARPVARDDLPQPFRVGDVHPVGLDDQVAPELIARRRGRPIRSPANPASAAPLPG